VRQRDVSEESAADALNAATAAMMVRTPPLQGYLAHTKQPPRRTLQWAYAEGPTVVLWGGAVPYERGSCGRE